MLEENKIAAENSENFSLKDFLRLQGQTLDEQTAIFSAYFRQTQAAGLSLYMREALTAADHRMQIRDPQTGEVREMVMMGSNNYLGLANHPYVKERVKEAIDLYGVGAGGPPLLNGTSELHRELEARLAALKGTDDAMLFSSGFLANVGWVGALVNKGDVVIFDDYNHASLVDGLRLTRCDFKSFRHNDMDHLRTTLKSSREAGRRNIFVVVEGVYSMDGDLGPLPDIKALCNEFEAKLIVDDAHGTGVMGKHGRGTAEHFGMEGEVDLAFGTFSKTFATTGGFLAARQDLIDYLRFFARTYMFSAAIPHPVIATVLGGLEVIESEPELITSLHANVQAMLKGLHDLGYQAATDSAIIPLFVPPGVDLRRLARRIHDLGLFVNPVEYPAVPLTRQRLRISMMASHTQADIDHALHVFEKVRGDFGLT